MLKEIKVPDIGSYSNVEIIEILVKEGDPIKKETSLITLETEKATLEVPSPSEGIVKNLKVKVGDKVSEGDLILTLETNESSNNKESKDSESKDKNNKDKESSPTTENQTTKQSDQKQETQEKSSPILKEITVPDIGAYKNVDVIEILVKEGDSIKKETSLITLETEKATLEVPSPYEGIVKNLKVKLGDKVSEGDPILTLEMKGASSEKSKEKSSQESSKEAQKETSKETHKDSSTESSKEISKEPQKERPTQTEVSEEKNNLKSSSYAIAHAGPGVRRFSRELGVDLRLIKGTGRKDRILQTDVQQYVKNQLKRLQDGSGQILDSGAKSLFSHLPPWPTINYEEFGPIQKEPLSRIKKLSGNYLSRNWVMVPHVTQFDEADITDLEQFRKESQSLTEEGVKLTPLVFIMKAVTAALVAFPNFNASLDIENGTLILKKYFHIGVAVDTPNGLVVPVVQNVDKKGLFQLAKELGVISQKARKGQLSAKEMQGSSFSISSLGGVGGTAFTPIINVPDVAILGVSRSQMKPIYLEGEFKARLMLPLSLSYDHRVIDGAEAARFTTFLVKQLSDIRRLLL